MEIKNSLKVIIAGQKKFAADILQRLSSTSGIEIVGVSYVKDGCEFAKLSESMKIQNFRLDRLPQFDVGITAHYFDKISEQVTEKARLGWVGYHPSLLPRHRGKNSIAESIKKGDCVIGGSVYWLDEGFDCGFIAAQDWCFRDSDSSLDLWINNLAPMGVKLISQVMEDIKVGRIVKQAQNEKFATYC